MKFCETDVFVKSESRKNISFFGLVAFLILLPFEYPLANLGVGSILRYVGVITMGLAILDVFKHGATIKMDYRVVLVTLWLLWSLCSISWSIDFEGFVRYYSMYLNNTLMFLIITLIRYNEKEVEGIKKAYILGVFLLYIYMTFVPGAVTYSEWQNRLTLASVSGEELIDQNYLAAIISMPYGLVLYDLMNKKTKNKFEKIYNLIFLLTSIYYVFMTGSRSGLIALIIMSLLNFLKGIKKNLVLTTFVVILLAISVPRIMNFMPKELMDRYSTEAMTGQTEESDDRPQIWKAALSAVNSHRVIYGYGAGSSEQIVEKQWHRRAAVHNTWIALLVEVGIVGLTLFGILIYLMLRELHKYGCYNSIVAFLGTLLQSVFLDVLTTKFFWGAMIALTVFVSINRTTVKTQDNYVLNNQQGEKK